MKYCGILWNIAKVGPAVTGFLFREKKGVHMKAKKLMAMALAGTMMLSAVPAMAEDSTASDSGDKVHLTALFISHPLTKSVDDMQWLQEIEDKAEGYACVIKELEAEADKFDAEIVRLTAQRDRYNNQVKRMKETLMTSMIAMGKTKIPTAHFKVSVANNGGLQPLFVEPDLSKLPEEYIIREPKADNKKIRDALAKGVALDFAHLEPRGQHLSIR